MISARTRLLLVMATLVSGVLAGGIVDRALIGTPGVADQKCLWATKVKRLRRGST
jgi:hypothetical protein